MHIPNAVLSIFPRWASGARNTSSFQARLSWWPSVALVASKSGYPGIPVRSRLPLRSRLARLPVGSFETRLALESSARKSGVALGSVRSGAGRDAEDSWGSFRSAVADWAHLAGQTGLAGVASIADEAFLSGGSGRSRITLGLAMSAAGLNGGAGKSLEAWIAVASVLSVVSLLSLGSGRSRGAGTGRSDVGRRGGSKVGPAGGQSGDVIVDGFFATWGRGTLALGSQDRQLGYHCRFVSKALKNSLC